MRGVCRRIRISFPRKINTRFRQDARALAGSRTGTAYHVAAPIRIKGKNFVASVLLKADEAINRMYVHEVFLKEKLQQSAFKTGADAAVATTGERARAGAGVMAKVLEEIYSVNTEAV